jgi:anaerobic selenocysteine-containing dehydrogenase
MDIEDGRVTKLIGDKDDPSSHGYTCAKGRDLAGHLYNPHRLLHPLRRNEHGDHDRISPDVAVAEVAERLQAIVDQHGPSSVALYTGTYGLIPPATMLAPAFMRALGSPMSFGCGSIDQPGKFIAAALHGTWRGGHTSFEDAEAWLFVGTNPLVSKLGGVPTVNPGYHMHRAKKRGIRLVVIDPRRSEIAKKAHVHLQPIPGQDAAVLAGMVRVVLEEGLHDDKFVDENAAHLDELRSHVDPFTPALVAERAGIDAEALVEAARVFASARTAGANAGTGANMAGHGALVEYLMSCLVTLCGFRPRAGDPVRHPGVLVPRGPRRAQPSAPVPAWGYGHRLHTRGLTMMACGMPTGVLADEMLLEGEGRVRALICIGGNPLMAWPDQLKTRAALESLDLLVVLDPKLNQTARLADYVIAPKLVPEIPTMTYDFEELDVHAPGWGHPVPYAAHRVPLIDPPEGSELLEDWEFLFRLGQRMGLELVVTTGSTYKEGDPPPEPVPLDMQRPPSTDDLFDILTRNARIPLDEVRKHQAGRLYEDPDTVVLAREPECEARLELADPVMMAQLDRALSDEPGTDASLPFRLISRREGDTLNSQGRDQPKLSRGRPHNPAYMHPDDLARLGIEVGSIIAIRSRRATIHAVAQAEDALRPGVVSMAHCYGLDLDSLGASADPGVPEPYSSGLHTGALVSAELDHIEDYTGLPRMSAIPVDVSAGPELSS